MSEAGALSVLCSLSLSHRAIRRTFTIMVFFVLELLSDDCLANWVLMVALVASIVRSSEKLVCCGEGIMMGERERERERRRDQTHGAHF